MAFLSLNRREVNVCVEFVEGCGLSPLPSNSPLQSEGELLKFLQLSYNSLNSQLGRCHLERTKGDKQVPVSFAMQNIRRR